MQDRARAMAQMRVIWHCELFQTTPALSAVTRACGCKVRRRRERCESATVDASQQQSSGGGGSIMDELTTSDDYLMMDMSDTLFSSLSTPALSTPRDLCMYS